MPKPVQLSEWITRARVKHGDTYEYTGLSYPPGRDVRLEAVCKQHGPFSADARAHCVPGKPAGCPACAADARTAAKVKPLSRWVEEWRAVHGDKYSYMSLAAGGAGRTNITYECPTHGVQVQDAATHRKAGCRSCGLVSSGLSRRNTFQELIDKANAIHNGKYTYIELEHAEPTPILHAICPDHGPFTTLVTNHVNRGSGCIRCRDVATGVVQRHSDEEWERKAKVTHGDKYEYVSQEYVDSRKFMVMRCPEHGEFRQDGMSHVNGCGCPKCGAGTYGNKTTNLMVAFLQSLGVQASEELRLAKGSYRRWDLSVAQTLAIELDGVYWHSEQYRPDSDMLDKANLAAAAGYRQINIWDDEWRNKQSIVERMLANAVGKSKDRKIAARKTTIAAVDHKTAQAFLEAHHIQGGVTASEHWGLHDGTELVALMSVTQKASGRDSSHNPEQMELQRYCTSANVQGGFQKLLKHVANRQGLKRITTFSDPRHFTGEIYKRAGFTLAHTYGPDYQYVKGGTRFSKRSRQKSWFLEESQRVGSSVLFDPDMTEHELANLNGYYRLYDRGRVRWELHL